MNYSEKSPNVPGSPHPPNVPGSPHPPNMYGSPHPPNVPGSPHPPNMYGSPHPPNAPGSPYSPIKQVSADNSTQWRDLWAAILFYAHLIPLVASIILSWVQSDILSQISWSHAGTFFLILFLVLVTATIPTLTTALFMKLLHRKTELMIRISVILSVVVLMLGGISNLILSAVAGALFGEVGALVGAAGAPSGMVALGLAGFLLWVYISQRPAITFSAMVMKTVLDCMKLYSSLYWILAALMGVLLFYEVFVLSIFYLAHPHSFHDIDVSYILLYCSLSSTWTLQVIMNVFQTTVAGVFATHYFLPRGQRADRPVSGAFRRSMTYSFGSLCFGALLVLPIQLAMMFLVPFIGGGSLGSLIVEQLVIFAARLLVYFNSYSYTHIAIYNKPFIQASQDTWNLVKRHGVSALINDSVTLTITLAMSLMGGLCCAIVSFLLMLVLGLVLDVDTAILPLIGAIVGFFIPFLVIWLVCGSGSATLFVCIAEDPDALRQNDPQFYEFIANNYSRFAAV